FSYINVPFQQEAYIGTDYHTTTSGRTTYVANGGIEFQNCNPPLPKPMPVHLQSSLQTQFSLKLHQQCVQRMRLARDYRQSKLLVQGVQVVSKVITGVKLPFETSHSSTFTTSLFPDLVPCDFSDEEPAYETTALKFRRSRGIDKNEACNQFLHLCMNDGKNHSCTEFSLRRKYQVNRFYLYYSSIIKYVPPLFTFSYTKRKYCNHQKIRIRDFDESRRFKPP
ncbi:hypothetical protein AVEN_160519-1, partial [Araneus ventricosus]